MPLVFSTDPEPEPKERAAKPDYPVKGQTARIWRDSKRRKGKTVTVIGGLNHNPETLDRLCTELKKYCGAGGSVKNGEIEIQGEHRERIATKLQTLGYKIKMVGG